MNFPVNQELIPRLAVFISVLLFMFAWETCRPLRDDWAIRRRRCFTNLALVFINTLLLRLVLPLTAVSMAVLADQHHWGLFNQLAAPGWLAIILSFLILDLAIYFQHRLYHYYPWLWCLHRVHHSDTEFDVTTGLRFHPLEIILSMLIKTGVVALTGAPVTAVIIFEIVLSATSLFNHGNVSLGPRVDPFVRWLVVTPDMHRVHHSRIKLETNSNFGFNIPWWDRLFHTYVAQPEKGHASLDAGLDEFRDDRFAHLKWLMIQPWLDARAYASGRQDKHGGQAGPKK